MMFGFFVTQILQEYIYKDDHNKIKLLLWKHVVNFKSNAILFNMTNMNEPTNTAPEWIKILNTISKTTDIFTTKTPPDLTVWKEHEGKWILNSEILHSLNTKNTALYAYRVIQGFGQKLNVQVSTRHYINIDKSEINNFILKVSGKEQQWYEWKDMPTRTIKTNSEESIIVTNGMELQEKIHTNVNDFLQRNFEIGHRLINKAGVIHPATLYRTGKIKETVTSWFMDHWSLLLKHNKNEFEHLSKYKFPTVITNDEFEKVKLLIESAIIESPIYYDKYHTEQIPYWLIVKNTGIFDEDFINIIALIEKITDFNKSSGEQQVKLVQQINKEELNLVCNIPEILNMAKILSEELKQKFQPIEIVSGIGFDVKSKKQITNLVALLESSDFNLDEFLNMSSEDSISMEDFCCPITGDIIEDPIMYDGHIYEKSALEQWFKTSRSSPLTRRMYDDNGISLQLENAPTIFTNALMKYKSKIISKL